MVSWIIPEDKQSEILQESKYYQLAGSFAKPLEEMIPQETLDLIKEKTKSLSDEKEEKPQEENGDNELELFEKLAQPRIKKTLKNASAKDKEEFDGYHESEREDLDRLIDSVE